MQLGVIGLGRMGANIVRRLTRDGHTCVVYDRDPAPGKELVGETKAASAVDGLAAMVKALAAPRTVWIMLPAGAPTEVDHRSAAAAAVARRLHHRRRQQLLA